MLIDPTAKIHPSALIGPNVTIGPNVVVGEGARIQRSVLLANSQVKDHAWVKSTIVGWNSRIGKWARTEGVTVLGDDVEVKTKSTSTVPRSCHTNRSPLTSKRVYHYVETVIYYKLINPSIQLSRNEGERGLAPERYCNINCLLTNGESTTPILYGFFSGFT